MNPDENTPEPTAMPGGPELPDIAGLDRALGLRRLGGRVDLYLRVLRQFVAHYGPALAQLEPLLTGDDPVAARRAAHSIKGATATLGALELPRLAEAVETGSSVDPQAARALCQALRALVDAIEAALPPAG